MCFIKLSSVKVDLWPYRNLTNVDFIYLGLTFWHLDILVIHSFSTVWTITWKFKIPLELVGFTVFLIRFSLILFLGCHVITVLSVWTFCGLWKQQRCNKVCGCNPFIHLWRFSAYFVVAMFFGPGWWTLLCWLVWLKACWGGDVMLVVSNVWS